MEKEEWVDSIDNGSLSCTKCNYRTNSDEHLEKHTNAYHNDDANFIYSMDCTGSISGRNVLCDVVDVEWIDCTGGQAAFEPGGEAYPLSNFGEDLVRGARANGLRLYNVLKIYDPGLGLEFPMWWVEGGIAAGTFERFEIPDDVNANFEHSDDSDDSHDSDYAEPASPVRGASPSREREDPPESPDSLKSESPTKRPKM